MTVKVVQETLSGPDNILMDRSITKVKNSPALRVNLPADLRATGCLKVIDDPNSAEITIPGVEEAYGKDIYHRDISIQNQRGTKVAKTYVAKDAEVTLSVAQGFTAIIELERFSDFDEGYNNKVKTRFTVTPVGRRK